ncbi:MAG: hypothetical protein AB7P03_03755 [Kofleriaceae bacterium]
MSNRTLAAIAFVMFMIAFIFVTVEIRDAVRGVSFGYSGSSPDVIEHHDPRTSAALVMIANELSLANRIAVATASKTQPELSEELRYVQFETDVSTRLLTTGVFAFPPLANEYKESLDKLSARYKQQHPGVEIPP